MMISLDMGRKRGVGRTENIRERVFRPKNSRNSTGFRECW